MKERLIFALDVDSFEQAQSWVKLLRGEVGMFKVGKQLFTRCGPAVVQMIRDEGGEVFLDLKYHDIPNTVAKASIEAARMGVKMFNVHALGGRAMMQCMVDEVVSASQAEGFDLPIMLGVTILTSSAESDLQEVGILKPVVEMVPLLADLAKKSGLHGVVASAQELALIRQTCGRDFVVVTPGVRPVAASQDDQQRVMTPEMAISVGADYLVVGRPISKAGDPVAAAREIVAQMAQGGDVVADLLYGVNPIIEALEQNRQLKVLWVLRGDTKPRLQLAIKLALESSVTVKRVDRFELDKMVGDVGHQGVVAQCLAPERTISLVDLINGTEAGKRFFLVLDGVTDPHNFGALIRSAVAAGCQGIIVGKDRSCPLTAVVEKTSAGATAHIPVCRVTNLSRAVEDLKSAGVWVYGLAGEESRCLYDVDLGGDVALVAGSEGKGLRPIIRKGCDALLSIPMLGAIQSLNVSVATGIALFEVVRHRVKIKK